MKKGSLFDNYLDFVIVQAAGANKLRNQFKRTSPFPICMLFVGEKSSYMPLWKENASLCTIWGR